MNKKIIIISIIIGSVVLVSGGIIYWQLQSKEEVSSGQEEKASEQEEEEEGDELEAPQPPVLKDPGASLVSGKSFTVEWNKVNNAVSYTLERATGSSFKNPVAVYIGENNSYGETLSVKNTTIYYYQVKASNDVGESDWSNVADIEITAKAPSTAPSSPILNDPGSSLSAGTSFSVSWSVSTGNTNYIVQRDTNSSFSQAQEIYSGSGNTVAQTLSPDDTTIYYYRVKASNSAGSSSWSNVVDIEITVSSTPPPPPEDPPSSPTLEDPGESFNATTSFGVSWSAVQGADSYTLERDTNSSFSSPTQAHTGSLNYYSEVLSPANTTTYYYRVKASNSAGSSSWSSTVDITINCVLPEAPVLSDPGSSIALGSSFPLTWSTVPGIEIYTLESDTDSSFSNPSSSQVAATSKTITPTSTGTYYYRVKVANLCGDSPWSNTVDMTVGALPDAPVLDDPGDVHPFNLSFNLTWSATSGATSYTWQHDDNSSFSSPSPTTVGAIITTSVSHAAAGIYYYRVRATTAFGNSAWSNTVDLQIIPFISDVPDANQPPPDFFATGWVGNWCVPMAASNVTEYWDVVMGDANAVGVNIGLGQAFGPPWVVADYIGWFMNTNMMGSMDRFPAMVGTSVINIAPGLLDWIVWDGQDPTAFGFTVPALVAPAVGKTSYVSWSIETDDSGTTVPNTAWDDYRADINNGRPVIISFDYWNPINLDITDGAIDFYDWGPPIMFSQEAPESPPNVEEEWYPDIPEFASGHSVTGVGYLNNYDPGDGGGVRDWAIVHDNWDTTAVNIAIPWQSWLANTYIQPLPNAAPEAPVIYDPGTSVNQGTNYNVNWDKVTGASFYCYEWDTESSFVGALGACTMDGSIISFSGSNTPGSTTYYYRAQACNNYGCSIHSDIVDMEIIQVPVTLNVPAEYATIQAAIDAAQVGDTVQIAAGTYTLNSSINLKSGVTIKGAGMDSTFLKGNNVRAIYLTGGSNVTISHLTVKDSGHSLTEGGGINISYSSDIIIKNCKIADNTAVNGAGIKFNSVTDALIKNCLIVSNYASNAAGGLYVVGSTVTIENTTITDNSGGASGGIDACAGSNIVVLNSIVWGNGSGELDIWGGSTFSATYSDIGETISGAGNINQNPLLVGGGNYHLQGGSPCVNAGNPAAQYNDTNGSRNDMGAYGGPGS